MVLEFYCENCKSEIVTKQKVGDIVECEICNHEMDIPRTAFKNSFYIHEKQAEIGLNMLSLLSILTGFIIFFRYAIGYNDFFLGCISLLIASACANTFEFFVLMLKNSKQQTNLLKYIARK